MGTKWNVFTNNLDLVNSVDGLVEGPAVSTDNAVARFDGTTGALLQNSGTTLSDADLLSTGELNLTTDLAVTHGGTGASSLTDGAYLLGSGTGAVTALDGTAKGAIPAGDGTTDPTILSVGLDAQVLTADSTEATGLKWTTVAGTGDVTAAAALTDNSLIRGNGGAKGVQDSGILIDDSDNLNIPTASVLQVNGVETLSATALGAAVVGSALTSVGTLTSGVWNGTAILDEYGGTGQTTYTKGDILYASAANVLSKLAIGTDNQVLKVATDLPNWETIAGGGDVSKVGTPVDSQVGVWTGDGTIEGDAAFTFDTSTDTLAVAASGKFNFGAVVILSDSAGTMTLSNVDALDSTSTQTVEDAMIQLDNLTTAGSLVTVGALNSGSITSGFGSIDNGASAITTTGVITGGTVEATTDTAAADNAAMGYTSGEGLVLTGQGSVTDVTIKNDTDATVISIPTGTTTVTFAGATDVSSGTVTGPSGTWDSGGIDIATTDTYAIAGTDVLNATTLGSAVVASSLTSVGTLTSGVWNGTAILDEYGGTGQTTWTKGDILYCSATNVLSKLPIGTDNQILAVNVDVPNWEAQAGGGDVTAAAVITDNSIVRGADGSKGVQDSGILIGDTDIVSGMAGLTSTGVIDFGGATSFELPNSTTPTVNADGEIAVDTLVTDWSHSILKYYGGEEMGVVAMPIAQFTSPTDNYVVTYNSTNDEFELQAGGGGSLPEAVFGGEASAHNVNTTTPFAPIEYVDLTTIELYVRAFANGTEEFMQGSFTVPADLGAGGDNVTFEVQGWAKTVHATNNLVKFTFGHRAIADSESIDGTYIDKDSGDLTTDGTQGDLDIFTWTQTITNTAWVAGDVVTYRFSRIAPSATELVGDYYVWRFIIRIPRA